MKIIKVNGLGFLCIQGRDQFPNPLRYNLSGGIGCKINVNNILITILSIGAQNEANRKKIIPRDKGFSKFFRNRFLGKKIVFLGKDDKVNPTAIHILSV
jgi:hypothetical protein